MSFFKNNGVCNNASVFHLNLNCIENAQESKQRRTEENPYGPRSCDEVSWLPLYCQLFGIIYFQSEFPLNVFSHLLSLRVFCVNSLVEYQIHVRTCTVYWIFRRSDYVAITSILFVHSK